MAGSVARSSLVAREPLVAEIRDDRRWEMVLTGGDQTSKTGRHGAGRLRLGLDRRASAGEEWAGRIRPRERERFSFLMGSNQIRLGADPSVAQGHRMSKMKFSLSSIG